MGLYQKYSNIKFLLFIVGIQCHKVGAVIRKVKDRRWSKIPLQYGQSGVTRILLQRNGYVSMCMNKKSIFSCTLSVSCKIDHLECQDHCFNPLSHSVSRCVLPFYLTLDASFYLFTGYISQRKRQGKREKSQFCK